MHKEDAWFIILPVAIVVYATLFYLIPAVLP